MAVWRSNGLRVRSTTKLRRAKERNHAPVREKRWAVKNEMSGLRPRCGRRDPRCGVANVMKF
jgi:hypothetical protein